MDHGNNRCVFVAPGLYLWNPGKFILTKNFPSVLILITRQHDFVATGAHKSAMTISAQQMVALNALFSILPQHVDLEAANRLDNHTCRVAAKVCFLSAVFMLQTHFVGLCDCLSKNFILGKPSLKKKSASGSEVEQLVHQRYPSEQLESWCP